MRLSMAHAWSGLNIHLASGAFWQITTHGATWPQFRRGVWPRPEQPIFSWWGVGYWEIRFFPPAEARP